VIGLGEGHLADVAQVRRGCQELITAGPTAGLATAEAIVAGGASAVTQINSLTSQIAAQGASLGETMRVKFHGAGITAAQGIVDGLEAQQKRLERVATRLAKALAKAVKKALGIKSPSRVFRAIGDQTVKGLTIGLDETYVRRAGARLATSLEQGFSQPALAAYTATGGRGGGTAVQINVNVPPGADKVAIGREVQSALEAYYAAGGRSRA